MKLSCLAAFVAVWTTPLLAQQSGGSASDFGGWQYDATFPDHLPDAAAPSASDINAINDLLARARDAWNTGDLEGYAGLFWNSPQLLVVLNNEQFQGWKAVYEAYKKRFPDSKTMGQLEYTRIQVRITKPDLALVEDTWTVAYADSTTQMGGSTTLNIQKVDGGWKVVSSFSRSAYSTSRGWEYDSIAPEHPTRTPSSENDDVKAINDVLLRMLDRWNAHDVDGYLSVFWNSPQLLIIDQEEQYQGWQSLYSAFKTGYPNPDAMGHTQASRIQIKLVRSDLAVAVTWWMATYPNSKVRVVGNTTMNLQKFPDNWKVVLAHSSFVEP